LNNLLATGDRRSAIQLEKMIVDWLYAFIRLNVKRGRIFDLREVLKTGQSDCLGYAKLLIILGRACGLDVGVVEVIIDNRGRNVPHTATLVKMIGGQKRFIDIWYGSQDIRHQRLGLRLKHGLQWYIEDIDYKDLKEAEDVSYLPDHCVDAITLYIEGNRSLKDRDYSRAVEQYTQAIALYPENARFFYNRAIAYENLGQPVRAQLDYSRALHDGSSIIRTLATQPDDVVDLIRLDEEHLADAEQSIFLFSQGFITGRRMSPAGIAKKAGLSEEEVKRILKSITQKL
jgi:tetratricopeptide (TPR) repeat protein